LLPGQDPLLSIFRSNPNPLLSNFRGSVGGSSNPTGSDSAMRFSALFNPNLSQQPPVEEAPSTSKKKAADPAKPHKSRKSGPSPESLDGKSVARGKFFWIVSVGNLVVILTSM
jgi:hypothetical protein